MSSQKLTLQKIKENQRKRRSGELCPSTQIFDEIDWLIKYVEMLQEKLSVVHCDSILESYKQYAATPQGQRELLGESEEEG